MLRIKSQEIEIKCVCSAQLPDANSYAFNTEAECDLCGVTWHIQQSPIRNKGKEWFKY